VIEFFADPDGVEIVDAVANGKAFMLDGIMYREQEQVRVVTTTGEIYEGLLEKVSTLKPGSKKSIVIVDETGVGHVIKYDLIADNGMFKLDQ